MIQDTRWRKLLSLRTPLGVTRVGGFVGAMGLTHL
jgi:hypothetical protein